MKNKLKLLLGLLLALCLSFAVACDPASTPESQIPEIPESDSDPTLESEPESTPDPETYVVTFVDYDDSVISTAEYELGATVNVPEDPTRDADETYTYEFAGWDSEVVAVDGEKTYKATYTPTFIEYTITFLDEDGATIEEQTYHYGDTVVAPAFPDVEPNEIGCPVYSWDKEVAVVAGNATYTRVEDFVYVDYTITFVDEDGAEISSAKYHYGDVVVVPENPTKPADETYTYEFAGWDSEVVAVAGDATYTATYNPVYIEYVVKFVNEDGTVLSEETYHYGDDVNEYAEIPTKKGDFVNYYTFASWDKEISTVTEDVTYTAVFTRSYRDNIKTSGGPGHTYGVEQSDNQIILKNSNLGDGANYAKGQNGAEGAWVHQSYLAIEGNYGLNSYVAFDFTGKNMPEVAFFAKNYNDSMYAEGTSKQGIVVVTGITTWDGGLESGINNNGTQVRFAHPFMIQDAAANNFLHGFDAENATSALGRANLVDGKHYRVIMGFTGGSSHGANGITLNWYLYDLDNNVVVEEASLGSYNFFTGSAGAVNNMTLNDLVGSVVLYGKFGATCTLDKVHGVFENTSIDGIVAGLNGATYTVTFKDAEGNVLDTLTDVAFGETVSYNGEMPTAPASDVLFDYEYAWDKSFAPISSDTVYTLTVVSTPKSGYTAYNTTAQGDAIVLGAGGIGDGANYTKGQNNGGYVNQAYLGIDGNFALNNYVVFDFTGKNMPEVAFFAKNYNNTMYAEGTDKQGIVVVTGITAWDGSQSDVNSNGTKVNYGFPYMIQDAADGAFTRGAAESSLARANLVDGTHYRVIMGFTGSGSAITLHWCLYNLDTATVVEEKTIESWGFFSGSNDKVGNMTLNDLVGSIVLYGKFGTTCTIDKLHGVEAGTFADVVAKYTA